MDYVDSWKFAPAEFRELLKGKIKRLVEGDKSLEKRVSQFDVAMADVGDGCKKDFTYEKDGTEREIHLHISGHRLKHQGYVLPKLEGYFLLNVRSEDFLTELKRAAIEYARQRRELAELGNQIAHIAHDSRNFGSVILSDVDVIEACHLDPEVVADSCKSIRGSVKDLTIFLTGIGDLTCAQEFNIRAYDIRSILRGLQDGLSNYEELCTNFTDRIIIPKEGIAYDGKRALMAYRYVSHKGEISSGEICISYDGPVLVRADKAKTISGLINIVRNAIQSQAEMDKRCQSEGLTPCTRRIDIGYDHNVIFVSDMGTGYKNGNLFEQDISRKDGGNAIGLRKTYSMMAATGGSLSYSNNEPCPGLTVRLKLPLVERH